MIPFKKNRHQLVLIVLKFFQLWQSLLCQDQIFKSRLGYLYRQTLFCDKIYPPNPVTLFNCKITPFKTKVLLADLLHPTQQDTKMSAQARKSETGLSHGETYQFCSVRPPLGEWQQEERLEGMKSSVWIITAFVPGGDGDLNQAINSRHY